MQWSNDLAAHAENTFPGAVSTGLLADGRVIEGVLLFDGEGFALPGLPALEGQSGLSCLVRRTGGNRTTPPSVASTSTVPAARGGWSSSAVA
jgi:hypothetical protein